MAIEAEERAQKLSPLERDMLLDFAGLETGKVYAGGAMWEITKDFCRSDLMTGWPQASLTPFGRRVAEIAHALSLQPQSEKRLLSDEALAEAFAYIEGSVDDGFASIQLADVRAHIAAQSDALSSLTRKLEEARGLLEERWLDTKSPLMRDIIESGRWPAAMEEAAKVAEGFATCPCNGDSGRCLENDGPRAIAAAIRALLSRADADVVTDQGD